MESQPVGQHQALSLHQAIPSEAQDVERILRLTPAVRSMFISEIKAITNLKAIGVGIGMGLLVTVVGLAIIRDQDWSTNFDGLLVLMAVAAGFVTYRIQRDVFAKETESHDDQMLRILNERYGRRQETVIICTAIIIGALAIALAIIATRLWL